MTEPSLTVESVEGLDPLEPVSDERLVTALMRSLRMLLASGEFQWSDTLDPELPEGQERLRRIAEMAILLTDIPDGEGEDGEVEQIDEGVETATAAPATSRGGAISSRLNTAEVQQLGGKDDSVWRYVPRWILVFGLVAATTFAVARYCNFTIADPRASAEQTVAAPTPIYVFESPAITPMPAPTEAAPPAPDATVEAVAAVEEPAPEPVVVEPTPVPPPPVIRYVVLQGDNLTTIARKYGVNPTTLQVRNGLANPDSLRVGQVLIIPN